MAIPNTSKQRFRSIDLLSATQQQLQALNLAMAEGKNDRQARAEAEKKVGELAQQVETFKKQAEAALENARQAREAAAQAQAGAARDVAVAREEAQQRIEKAANAHAYIVREAQQELERAVAAGKDDRESVVETERKMAELVKEAEGIKERDQRTLHNAKMMREVPTVARDYRDVPSRRSVGQDRSTSVKWVKVRHEAGPLETDEEALKILVGVRDRDPLNLLTIVGAARHGKSFLMNALAGADDVFCVSPEAVACTAGADLSPILMPLSDFKRAGGGSRTPPRPPTSAEPTVAFVDMEGQGDKSEQHDVRLAAPFLLLSKVKRGMSLVVFSNKQYVPPPRRIGICIPAILRPPDRQVVIFNWMGLPNKHTMLQELVVMVKAAEKVLMESEDKSRPTFGHLIILMRDVDGKVAEVEELVLGHENTRNLKHEQKKDPMERNAIREGLVDAFESITFHTMPSPHRKISGNVCFTPHLVCCQPLSLRSRVLTFVAQTACTRNKQNIPMKCWRLSECSLLFVWLCSGCVLSDGAVPLSQVEPDFATSLDQLRVIIAERLSAVHTFAGKDITGGVRLNDIVVGLCESVNRTDKICPPRFAVHRGVHACACVGDTFS